MEEAEEAFEDMVASCCDIILCDVCRYMASQREISENLDRNKPMLSKFFSPQAVRLREIPLEVVFHNGRLSALRAPVPFDPCPFSARKKRMIPALC